MSYRQEFHLIGESQREACKRVISNLPLDGSMTVKITPYSKPGSAAQRGAWWGIRLGEFADQAWDNGKQYSVHVWHYLLKERFLPNAPEDGLTLPGYEKWVELPDGSLKMIGSTERLTAKGRAQFMEQVEAFGAQEFGIMFSEIKQVQHEKVRKNSKTSAS